MRFVLSYEQTPHERYDTDMNERFRQRLLEANISIVGESGGSGITNDMDALVADAEFEVETDLATLNAIAGSLEAITTRPITISDWEAR